MKIEIRNKPWQYVFRNWIVEVNGVEIYNFFWKRNALQLAYNLREAAKQWVQRL